MVGILVHSRPESLATGPDDGVGEVLGREVVVLPLLPVVEGVGTGRVALETGTDEALDGPVGTDADDEALEDTVETGTDELEAGGPAPGLPVPEQPVSGSSTASRTAHTARCRTDRVMVAGCAADPGTEVLMAPTPRKPTPPRWPRRCRPA